MATKIKGEAIKEDSIPLSALSNEVRNKIENAGGGALDPVVWKYMCDPYIVESQVPLPEELKNIIERENGTLKRIALKLLIMVDWDANFHALSHMSDNTIHSSFASFEYNKEEGYFEIVIN